MSSYDTIANASIYFQSRLVSTAWDLATDEQREAALILATQQIDRLNFIGDKYDSDQELEFPRGTDTTIPQSIKYACFELAYAILDGYDIEHEMRNIHTSSMNFLGVRKTFDGYPEHIVNGIVSFSAWSYLRPYLRTNRNLTLSRSD
jgi:hypothetical protein